MHVRTLIEIGIGSLGRLAIRVERAADISSTVEQSLSAGKPAVVDVASDIEAFAPWTRTLR